MPSKRIVHRRDPAPTRVTAHAAELPDVLQFMQLLWAIVHGLQTHSKKMQSELGVTGPQRLVLRVVGLFPGVSAGALAAILHVHPSTLTGVLQRLGDQGMLRRAADAGDRRISLFWLTPRGARVNARRRGTVEATVVSALKALSPRDRAATQRVLTAIAGRLKPTGTRSA
jgi:DNA-binding MarR family transcriptional regulator